MTAPNSWRQDSTKALNELLRSESKEWQLYKKTLFLSCAVALFDSYKNKLSESENLPREWLIEIYENTLMWSSLHAEEHLSWAAYPTAVMPRVFNQYWTALLLSCGLGYSMKAKNRANHEQEWNWRKQKFQSYRAGAEKCLTVLSATTQHYPYLSPADQTTHKAVLIMGTHCSSLAPIQKQTVLLMQVDRAREKITVGKYTE